MAGAALKEPIAGLQREALKAAGGTEMSANKVAAEKLANAIKKNEGAKALADAKSNVPNGVSEVRGKDSAEANIYYKDAGPAATAQEQQKAQDQLDKRGNARAAIKESSQFVAKGYESLTGAQQKELRDQALSRLEATSYLTDLMNGMNPAQREKFAEALIKTGLIRSASNRILQEGVARRITDKDKSDLATQLGISHEEAAGRLESDYLQSLELPNIIDRAIGEYLGEQITHVDTLVTNEGAAIDAEAKKMAGEKLDQNAQGLAKTLENRWNTKGNEGKVNVNDDFESLLSGGIESVLLKAEQRGEISRSDREAILKDPDLREKYEGQITVSLLAKRLRTKQMNKDDIRRLADAQWCGTDKIIEMFENHKVLESFIKEQQGQGMISRDWKEKLGLMSQDKRKTAIAILLGILLGGPIAAVAGAPLLLSLGVGGAGAAGLGMMREN